MTSRARNDQHARVVTLLSQLSGLALTGARGLGADELG